MSILQISRIQHRRGLQQDLPQLASAELGWSIDTRKLYIGNGTIEEGAPAAGMTEILTEYSIADFTSITQAQIAALQSQVIDLGNSTGSLQSGQLVSLKLALPGNSNGMIQGFAANNALITYTLTQGTSQRYGTIKIARLSSSPNISYNEEYDQTDVTDIAFSFTSNSAYANLNYATTTATSLMYRIERLT